jgi:hypothetical protein
MNQAQKLKEAKKNDEFAPLNTERPVPTQKLSRHFKNRQDESVSLQEPDHDGSNK